MIYDVDFKNKQLTRIEKNDYEKKEYTVIDEMVDDPVFEFVKDHLPPDQYELYTASVRHYLNCLFIKDTDEWIKFIWTISNIYIWLLRRLLNEIILDNKQR